VYDRNVKIYSWASCVIMTGTVLLPEKLITEKNIGVRTGYAEYSAA